MYIQITSRCNMVCRHCCYSCTSTGVDMHRAVFLAACKLARQLDVFIDIGGGEPTLHPLFWDFIGIALRYKSDFIVCTTTNGKITDQALALARVAKLKVLRVDLSLDEYHEPIDYSVVKAFEKSSGSAWNYDDFRGIRDVTHDGTMGPAPFGRAAEWASDQDKRCPGNDLSVAPDGVIFACGCRTVTYGTVFEPELPDPLPDDEWCPDKLG